MVRDMTPEERLRAMEKAAANSNVVELNVPNKEEQEAMEIQEEILEEFGPTGLFCMQIVSSVFGDLNKRLTALEERQESTE